VELKRTIFFSQHVIIVQALQQKALPCPALTFAMSFWFILFLYAEKAVFFGGGLLSVKK
jgi:hypothetical protein